MGCLPYVAGNREPPAGGRYLSRVKTPPKTSSARSPAPLARSKSGNKTPLVTSQAQAEREKKALRRGRSSLESEPRTADTDIRTSLI